MKLISYPNAVFTAGIMANATSGTITCKITVVDFFKLNALTAKAQRPIIKLPQYMAI